MDCATVPFWWDTFRGGITFLAFITTMGLFIWYLERD